MRYLVLYLLLVFFSCRPPQDKEKGNEAIEGKWLIVYPDEQLRNADEERIYAAIQDSVVELKGLKLVAFDANGRFYQADHPERKGAWHMNEENQIVVEGGGPGFSPFRVKLSQAAKGSAILTEFVKFEGEHIRLDWHLVKLGDKDAAVFFDDNRNKWMKRPEVAETSLALKQKLAMMLDYYAAYYLYIKDRSSYFIPGRVVLPFQFYQHAVGLKPLKRCPDFQHLFYDSTQAAEAHGYLEDGMRNLSGKFPKSDEDSYVHEYAMYMKLLAEEMREM